MTNGFLKISLVTPSFNQGHFIRRTIESILGQGYPNLEYIVMDGGSTDETVDILKSYGDKIIWKSEKDKGQSDAINKGMRLATGEILAYLNSDDTYVDKCLFQINDYFLQNAETKWVYGKCRIINEHDQEVRKFITAYKNFWGRRYSYKKLLSINFINQPATFWRRDLLDSVGFFSEQEHLVMDYEYWLRVGSKFPAGVIGDYLANFRVYSQSKSFQYFQKQFRDELRVAKQHTNDAFAIFFHYLNYLSIVAGYRLHRLL